MNSFVSYLTELFDQPLPVRELKRIGYGPTTIEVTYQAQTRSGQYLNIDITKVKISGWEINFTLDGSHNLTNHGKPHRILATVGQAVRLFLKDHMDWWDELPKELIMVSKSSESKRDAVYSAMMRRLGKEFGYTITDRYTTGTPENRRTVTTAKLTVLPLEKVEASAKPPAGMKWKNTDNSLRGTVPESYNHKTKPTVGGRNTGSQSTGAREPQKFLRVFDFDDTLAHTKAYVGVLSNGKTLHRLSSLRFKEYLLKPGETYDFSGANKVIDPRPIGAVLKVMREVLAQGKKTVILTGRTDGNSVRKWLQSIGIDVPVFTVGHTGATHTTIAQRKRDWLETAIQQGYTDIEFWDDNAKNIQFAKTLKSQFPHVRLRTRLVKYKSKQGVHEERDYKAEYTKMYGGDNPTPKQRVAMKKKTARKRVLRRMGREGRSNDGKEIDHKNGNALDSRPSNLRLVSRHTNRSKDNNKWRK